MTHIHTHSFKLPLDNNNVSASMSTQHLDILLRIIFINIWWERCCGSIFGVRNFRHAVAVHIGGYQQNFIPHFFFIKIIDRSQELIMNSFIFTLNTPDKNYFVIKFFQQLNANEWKRGTDFPWNCSEMGEKPGSILKIGLHT